jgi:integrase
VDVSKRAGNGEGSLYQRRSDGRWVGAVFLGYDESGQPRWKTVTARTRAEAAKKLRSLQHIVDDGLPPPDDKITVAQLLDEWLKDVVPLRVSGATLSNYKSVVENHIKPTLGRKRLSKLSPQDVQRLITLKLGEGLSTRTVRLIQGILVQALQNAMRRGRIPTNVASLTDGPRLKQKEGRSLTEKEAKSFLEAASGDRLEALNVLMLATGIRTGEALGLTWSNVDLDRGRITIKQALTRKPGGNEIGHGKTGRSGWRSIPIATPEVKALETHHRRQENERKAIGKAWADNDLVFCTPIGTPLDPDNHRKAFSNLTRRAGLGHWHPHELRHSAASIMLANNVPLEVVSEVLGHQSIRITKDVYGHIAESQLEVAAQAVTSALFDE